MTARPPSERTFTRTYPGNSKSAMALFQVDAAKLARDSYVPVSQQYVPGSWGAGAFILALLLAIVLIGILIFIYLIVVKPPGQLVVVYEYRPTIASAEPATPVPAAIAPRDPMATLAALANMRDQGLITTEEFDAKKAELLSRL